MKNLVNNKWLPFEEAHEIVLREARRHGAVTRRTWYKVRKKISRFGIPSDPSTIYKEWKGWEHWLGTENYTKWLFFEKALDIARKKSSEYNIFSCDEWKRQYSKIKGLEGIPKYPNYIYKNKGWVSWEHWLDNRILKQKRRKARSKFLLFDDAVVVSRKLSKKYKIQIYSDWIKFCNKKKKPLNIPSYPQLTYKENWLGWEYWLGVPKTGVFKKGVLKRKWRSFPEALKFVRNLSKHQGINTRKKWYYEYMSRGKKPKDIPSQPDDVYKGKGWVSWGHWFGTDNIRGQKRKYKVNDDFFKKWTSDMAYVLGFWWADGYIRKRNNTYGYSYGFGISQKSDDKYILKEILDKMDSNNTIYQPKSRPEGSHFEINSKIIFKDIVRRGGSPNKSLITRFPKVPKKYFVDFIRGLFDGDGSISLCGKRKNSPSSYICSGSFLFIQDLYIIMKKWKIEGKITNNGNKSNICYLLKMGAGASRKLGELMYYDKDIIKLKRKYEKFKLGGAKIL